MRRPLVLLATAVAVTGSVPLAAGVRAAPADPAVAGSLGPVISQGARPECLTAQYDPSDGYRCPPAAMAAAVLSTGQVLFWDGLEGMNKVQANVVAEFGDVAQDDQIRVASFRGESATFTTPGNQTAAPDSRHSDAVNPLVPGGAGVADSGGNNYDLFCSPLVQLADGTLLTAGGTHYYEEPGVTDPSNGRSYGVAELQGLKATRIFDPRADDGRGEWRNATGDMHFGRWYPTMVTLPGGHILVASGVTKLIKPAYTDGRPPQDSARNVVQTETYDPASETWSVNPSTADQSLPLFPRLHLLPDGTVYYDAGGQTFNPDGQAYDEATWVHAKDYDPSTRSWTDLSADTPTGLPDVAGVPVGFRGSGFSVMLPLRPNGDGSYTQARVLNGGGVVGVTPGDYLGDDSTTINTIDTANGDALHSANGPRLLNRRWYGSAVVLPDGTVFVTNGATRDEVVLPGSGEPVLQTELIDPDVGTVTAGPSLDGAHDRTYHNTAVLLPDARVLIGGHAPIATAYSFQSDAGKQAGLSTPEADSTFQIYSPPYLHYGVSRPVIDGVEKQGHVLDIETHQAGAIGKVVLVRNPSITHLTDGDQRTVELSFTRSGAAEITARIPGPTVVPPGPYMLFIERRTVVDGVPKYVPSVSRQVMVQRDPADVTVTLTASSAAIASAATVTARSRSRSTPTARPAPEPELRARAAADRRGTPSMDWFALCASGALFATTSAVIRRRLRRSG